MGVVLGQDGGGGWTATVGEVDFSRDFLSYSPSASTSKGETKVTFSHPQGLWGEL